jgi:glucose-1-phosphate thymidylyltransferase
MVDAVGETMMKGVVLAGGTGSRLRPLTWVTNKHLLPVYDKPMIYYPLNNFLKAGISDIFVVTGGEHFDAIGRLLGSGKKLKETLNIDEPVRSLAYGVQDGAGGIAEALGLAEQFVGKDPMAVVLGDNIFEDERILADAVKNFTGGAHIFLKEVPEEILFESTSGTRRAKFGMAELAGDKVVGIEEKPVQPKTRYAVTGAYLYDNAVFDIIKTLNPSWRGELEITDVNNEYIRRGQMKYTVIKGSWSDAGSIHTLHRATALRRGWLGHG